MKATTTINYKELFKSDTPTQHIFKYGGDLVVYECCESDLPGHEPTKLIQLRAMEDCWFFLRTLNNKHAIFQRTICGHALKIKIQFENIVELN